MRKSLIPVLGVTLAAAAVLAVGTASTAQADPLYTAYGTGTGATSAAAENAAIANLNSNNFICFPVSLKVVYDTKQSSGIWAAEVSERCQAPGGA